MGTDLTDKCNRSSKVQ